jgi:hypothetical protein
LLLDSADPDIVPCDLGKSVYTIRDRAAVLIATMVEKPE